MPLLKRRNKQPDVETLAKAVAAEMAKASQIVPGLGALPRGADTTDLAPLAAAVAQGISEWATVPFGPGMPIPASSIDPREPATGAPAPRLTEFPVAINTRIQQSRDTPFEVLRTAADRVDVMRRCIEARKSHLLSLDWDITLSKSAIKRIMAEDGTPTLGKAFQVARERFEPDMARLRDWWVKPDQPNGLDFPAWLGMLLEEQLVIDAVSIYPHYKLNGQLLSLELIDGATIKPLRDRRGGTPMAPLPAYQQIIYGFPRGDYQASNTDDVTGSYHTAQLLYRPRHRRSFTPYGFPEVEHALSAVDLWLKTIGWLRSEFDDGTTPDTWMMTDMNAGGGPASLSPDQLRQWETIFNQMLAGDFAERRAVHLLPKGFQPKEMRSFQDKFKPDLFEMLVKIVCMCFSVMPTEIGFPPSSGIGGKGHQEGEANSAYRKDIRPSVTWLQGLITEISRSWLGMPAELQFTFIGYETEDQAEAEQVSDARVKSGRTTLNEERSIKGLPLYEFDEADTPFVQTSTGLIFLPGEMARQADASAAAAVVAATAADPPAPDDGTGDETDPPGPETDPNAPPATEAKPTTAVPDGHVLVREHTRPKPGGKAPPAATEEAAKFASFARKRTGRTWRDFAFEHLEADVGKALNAAGAAGDLDRIKTLVADLGKGKPRRVSAGVKERLTRKYAASIGRAVGKAIHPDRLIARWAEHDAHHKAAKPTSESDRLARAMIRSDIDDEDLDDLETEIDDMLDAGWDEGIDASGADPDDVDKGHRYATLMARAGPLVTAITGSAIASVATALLSGQSAEQIGDIFANSEWAAGAIQGELTAALTTGVRDGATAQNISYVRIVASAGECDFCAGYDSRILGIDDDGGMPPLHNGCNCDITPLENDG